MKMIDSHAHLMDVQFNDDLEEVVARAKEGGVEKIVCAGYDILSSCEAIKLAKDFESVYATVGIHPENVLEFDGNFDEVERLAQREKVVAIGEVGLDYHFFDDLSEAEIDKVKTLQKEVFCKQIEIANKLNLPIVVHSRDAMGDTIDLLQKNPPKMESLLHCYGGSVESAKILVKLGFVFSFGGVVTFKNAKTSVDVVEALPMEKILLETDCPYLSPVPFRGKRNEPKNVVYVADMISKIKSVPIEEVARITTENAKRLYNF